MTSNEVLKELRRDLDNVRINAKTACKRHDQLSEKYNEGREDGLLAAIELIKLMEVQP